MEMAKVLGKPLKLSDMPRRTATQRVNNTGSVASISRRIFDLSKKLSEQDLNDLAAVMDKELGSDLAAPVKAD